MQLTWLAMADPSVLSAGQTSVVAGAIALMLHERVSALRKLQPMSRQPPHLLLDSALWVLRSPPASLPTDRAAFMWWTGTASQYRRCPRCSPCILRGVLKQAQWCQLSPESRAGALKKIVHCPIAAPPGQADDSFNSRASVITRAVLHQHCHPLHFAALEAS